MRLLVILLLTFLAWIPALGSVQARSAKLLAPTPSMGWNSWDSFGLTVDQQEVEANAAWMARHLKRYGWRYVVVDEGWYLQNPESDGKPHWRYTLDKYGRYQPAPNRFPSAEEGKGFRSLAGSIHSLGLLFGIHIIRGIPREAVEQNLPIAGSVFRAAEAANQEDTCAWNHDNYGVKPDAAGQAYYDSLIRLYASWGVDFIKVDCIATPYKAAQIAMISKAIQKSGRAIVLSLSPGPTPIDEAQNVRKYAQMWRITNDFWDIWARNPGSGPYPSSLRSHFRRMAQWAPYVEAGHWPDADMLPIGYLGPRPGMGEARQTRLTRDEQRTVMTLWSIFRSPWMMGGNLVHGSNWTDSLLSNPEVIAVDQHSVGGHPVITTPYTVIWAADAQQGGAGYIAAFNISDHLEKLSYAWRTLKLPGVSYEVRDLWARRNLGTTRSLRVVLRPHASVLYRITRQ